MKLNRPDLVEEYYGRSVNWAASSVHKRIASRSLVQLATVHGLVKVCKFTTNMAYHDDNYVAVSRGKNISMMVLFIVLHS